MSKFKRVGMSLVPAEAGSEDVLLKIKDGDIVDCEIKKKRSTRQHRLYWSLISLAFENQNESSFKTPEDLSNTIKIIIGHCTYYKVKDQLIPIPKSISFKNTDQIEFNEIFNKAVDFIVSDIVPNVDRIEFEREVFDRIGLPWEI